METSSFGWRPKRAWLDLIDTSKTQAGNEDEKAATLLLEEDLEDEYWGEEIVSGLFYEGIRTKLRSTKNLKLNTNKTLGARLPPSFNINIRKAKKDAAAAIK